MKRYDWPGNIRELQNVVERAVIMSAGSVLNLDVPGFVPRAAAPVPIRTLAEAEREHITATLRGTNWIVGGRRGAAAQLGLPRTTLIARMQRLGISSGSALPGRVFATAPRENSRVIPGAGSFRQMAASPAQA
jgi:formate hydrogenlyase transcriptional activator